MNGISLLSLFKKNSTNILPAYFEGTPQLNEKTGKSIGIRTTKFKYYRSRNDSKENIHLFDLKNDPLEKHNIAELNLETVSELEQLLQNTLNEKYNSTTNETMDEDEIEKAKKILDDLGYI